MPRLFSYGTLQLPEVQRATFGRELEGHADALPGYVRATLAIRDAGVVSTSGVPEHPIARHTGDPADSVEGVVLTVTDAELAAADSYEVDDYVRVTAVLVSGIEVEVYVARDARRPD